MQPDKILRKMPTMLTIRPAEIDECSIISLLIQTTIGVSNKDDYSPESIAAVQQYFSTSGVGEKMARRDMLVAVVNDVIVGTVSIEGNGLYTLFVSPDVQKQGIAQKLVDFVETRAAANGHSSIHVSSSITAQGFYKKLNYQTLHLQPHKDGDTYLMEKKL